MKNIIFILFIPLFSDAQKLDGVWGLKWGISADSAISIIKGTKGYTPEIKRTDTTTTLIIYKAKWAFETSTYTRLEFYKNKFYSAYAFFYPDIPAEYFRIYNSIKTSVTDKYFEPQMDVEEYKQPFTKNDPADKRLYAIFEGNAYVGSGWDFSIASKLQNDGRITLKISKEFGVYLWYQDENVSRIVTKQVNQKAKSDF